MTWENNSNRESQKQAVEDKNWLRKSSNANFRFCNYNELKEDSLSCN